MAGAAVAAVAAYMPPVRSAPAATAAMVARRKTRLTGPVLSCNELPSMGESLTRASMAEYVKSMTSHAMARLDFAWRTCTGGAEAERGCA